jgi:glycosyltransferase involved in cell wall biosynthesis
LINCFLEEKLGMKILFLDQTGQIAGAEQVLLDVAYPYRDCSLVGLFETGPLVAALEKRGITVQVLASEPLNIRRESGLLKGLSSLNRLLPLVKRVACLSQTYDLVYANTPKALVVAALALCFSRPFQRRPLVYHLHDILSGEHFSAVNRNLLVWLANTFASRIIAVSYATKAAFIAAGGRAELVEVIYNGFDIEKFRGYEAESFFLRQQLELEGKFVVGHFSRLSPWKGQHILIQALTHCSAEVVAVLVGDALFGEDAYLQELQAQVEALGLGERVKFLGFRSDIAQLMAACHVVAHTSIAPEPSARVLIEAMLTGKALIATRDGGTVELVEDGTTGWLVAPADPVALATMIMRLKQQPEQRMHIAQQAQQVAGQRFGLAQAIGQVDRALQTVLATT